MAVLYTAKQIQEVLRDLRIKPVEGKVTGREAARILTWRAKEEQDIEHVYPDSAVRQHVQRGNLKAYPVNRRFNLYKAEDVFDVALAPRRGLAQQKEEAA